MVTKKHNIDLESFKDILHICPRVPGQPFAEPPFEEEILAFIHFLGHSAAIRTLTDVNINKLYQSWRSFAALINKCLTGKSSSYDSLRLSQAQILWGLYHKRNIDYAYLIHQNAQQFGVMLPIELMNDEIRNSKAYKEYYAIATGEPAPKPKASAMRTRSSSDTSITPPTIAASPRLKASAKGKQTAKPSKAKSTYKGTVSKPGVPNVQIDESEEELSWNSMDNKGDDNEGKDGDDDEEDKGDDGQEGNGNDDDDEGNDGEEGDDDDADQEVVRDDDKDDVEEGGDDEHESDEETREEEALILSHKPLKTTNQFTGAVSAITEIVQRYMDQQMNEGVKFAVKEQVKAQVSKILPRIEQAINEQLEAEVLTRSSYSSRTSYAFAADLSEMELKKILIEKMEGNKSIQCSDEQRNLYKALVDAYEFDKIILNTYGETIILKRRRGDDEDKDEEPSAGPDRGSKRRREGKEPESSSAPMETATRSTGMSTQGSRSRKASARESALAEEPLQITSQMEEPSHSEFDTGVDDQPIVESSQHPEWFSQPQKPPTSNRDWNKTLPALRVDTLTPDLLAGPTYDLIKGSSKSLIELEYHLEEVYKATTDQLDWVNLEGQQYPHNLLQPLSLIPDNRGRRVIPFARFINNDAEYLRGGASSRKYTTSVTKTKAADYGHIKWIEDLVSRTMWIQEPIDYDKHALWGVSHWGRKRQQFYCFTVNRESAHDVYSKRRIIVVKELKIVEWHCYKHLDWITNKDKKNRLMRIDELHKFSDGTLTDVRTALDDRLKGIQMWYLPQTIRRKSDKDRTATMIQAIDKILKTRRVMRSLKRFESSNSRKDFANAALKNELRKLKGKNVINIAVSKLNATTIAPGMFKLDLEALAAKLLKNKDAHIDYIKYSREHANMLREIVKNARALSSLDINLDPACVDLLMGTLGTNIYTLSIDDMMKSSPICLLSKASKTKSWLWHRRLSHLNFGTINQLAKQGLVRGLPKLKFEKDHLCSACSLGKSKKHSHKPKSKDTNQEKLYMLHMDLCRPMRVESINGKKYILVIFDDYSWFTWVKFLRSKDEAPEFIIKLLKMIHVRLNATVRNIRTDNASALYEMTPGTLNLGLVTHSPSSTPFVPPIRIDSDTLFQQLFDRYFSPPPRVDHPVPEVAAPESAVSTSTPSSTSIDQDAPLPSTSQTPQESASHVIPPDAEEANHDIKVAHMDNDPYFGLPIPKPNSKESSSQDVTPNNVRLINQPPEHISKWTKHHPIDNVICDPSRPVFTRHQLETKALFCYFDAFLSFIEPKSYKEALTESC
uniref:Integrase, catalytic region, zinc finger, CCHC-type, peptidase aspartic, catalytic n=1 Tax=Tanacetum cinerariifolium TaxID=118510 RepID=A0A699H7G8_TANCI|nr:integrase, catalytic region, zinc finger, CCHC-type, peptidase aspartic, catalytic [Tanacetum cinerariifolium]